MASLSDLRLITHPLQLSYLQRMLGSIGSPAHAAHLRRRPAGAIALLIFSGWRAVHPRPAPRSHSEVFEATRSLTLLHFDPIDQPPKIDKVDGSQRGRARPDTHAFIDPCPPLPCGVPVATEAPPPLASRDLHHDLLVSHGRKCWEVPRWRSARSDPHVHGHRRV